MDFEENHVRYRMTRNSNMIQDAKTCSLPVRPCWGRTRACCSGNINKKYTTKYIEKVLLVYLRSISSLICILPFQHWVLQATSNCYDFPDRSSADQDILCIYDANVKNMKVFGKGAIPDVSNLAPCLSSIHGRIPHSESVTSNLNYASSSTSVPPFHRFSSPFSRIWI